jgi:Sec-independent protein translocase protein TatA
LIWFFFVFIFISSSCWMPNINLKKVYKMNKILLALGLIATIALVGCNKDKAPETGATTGEHVENAVDQAKHDVENATKDAASATAQAADHAANATATAVDHAADATAHAADATVDAAKNATATAAGAVEKGAADVKEKAQQ